MKFVNIFMLFTSCLAQATDLKGGVVLGDYLPGVRHEPQDIPYNKFTHINCQVGALDSDISGVVRLVPHFPEKVKTLVKLSRQAGVKPLLSIGTPSRHEFFSRAVSPSNRDKFIKSIVNLIEQGNYKFDGININWYFPSHVNVQKENQSKTTDQVLPDISEDFFYFLKELRETINNSYPNESMTLSASVLFYPNEVDQPVNYNISEYAEYFDFIILNPFYRESTQTEQLEHFYPISGIKNTIISWLNSGFPRNKLIYGFGSFVRGGILDINYNCPSINYSSNPLACNLKDQYVKVVENSTSHIYRPIRYMFFRNYYLNENGEALNGFINHWDNNAQASWLYNHDMKYIISYNSFEALKVQVDLIKKFKLAGVMIKKLSIDHDKKQLNFISNVFL